MTEKAPKYKKGEVVQHTLQKEWLMILDSRMDTSKAARVYTCRTKKMELKDFWEFELEKAPGRKEA
jgi:hypothetical protein